MATEDELLGKLERWLAGRPAPPSIFEVIETGDGQLAAAFVLKHFRSAAKQAVVDRLRGEAGALYSGDHQSGAGAALRVMDGIATAWMLTEAQRLSLLGLRDPKEFEAARAMPIAELPIDTIERLAVLLDIFQSINILLPEPARADTWIRTPNKAAALQGASALHVMLSGLEGLRKIRAYLKAQLHGG
jgi:rhodanese-related sulfurtransferase